MRATCDIFYNCRYLCVTVTLSHCILHLPTWLGLYLLNHLCFSFSFVICYICYAVILVMFLMVHVE